MPHLIDPDDNVVSPNIFDIDFNGKEIQIFDRAAFLPRMEYLDEKINDLEERDLEIYDPALEEEENLSSKSSEKAAIDED